MTQEEFQNLDTGDIIRNRGDDKPVVVHANYGDRVTAVRTFDVTNPREWDLLAKVSERELHYNDVDIAVVRNNERHTYGKLA